ncbi:hypothetical protein WJX84_000749 [Apatococcus fuscideae]|uniref:Uncharacterized protein n=1 Tax=Apatococcus fuscideae TaxID=2026836 RepID=A0AAW1TJK5_9CHLO
MHSKQPPSASRMAAASTATAATPFAQPAAQAVQPSRSSFSRSTRSHDSNRSSASGSQHGDQTALPPRRASASSQDGGNTPSATWPGLKSRRNSHNGSISTPISEYGDSSVHGPDGRRPSLDKKSSHSLPPEALLGVAGSPPKKSVRKSSSWRAFTETLGNFRKSSSHRSLASQASNDSR